MRKVISKNIQGDILIAFDGWNARVHKEGALNAASYIEFRRSREYKRDGTSEEIKIVVHLPLEVKITNVVNGEEASGLHLAKVFIFSFIGCPGVASHVEWTIYTEEELKKIAEWGYSLPHNVWAVTLKSYGAERVKQGFAIQDWEGHWWFWTKDSYKMDLIGEWMIIEKKLLKEIEEEGEQ